MRRVRACDLMLEDLVIVEPERGSRSYPVVKIARIAGKLPIEVTYQGKGTWHYSSTETVMLRD